MTEVAERDTRKKNGSYGQSPIGELRCEPNFVNQLQIRLFESIKKPFRYERAFKRMHLSTYLVALSTTTLLSRLAISQAVWKINRVRFCKRS